MFEIKDFIIYAQEGIVSHLAGNRTPSGIYHQHETRPAVQTIMELYCSYFAEKGWGCAHFMAFSLSDLKTDFFPNQYKDNFKIVLEEAEARGYVQPEFDAVLTAVRLRKDKKNQPFDLDRALGEFYLQRYDPKKIF